MPNMKNMKVKVERNSRALTGSGDLVLL
jgi:hypothetical protein